MTGRTPQDWARLLADGWERRARHPSRDFFVASNPGWSDPATWERYARQDLELFLVELDRERLRATDVLEIGCGSGRLVPFLRPLVRSYTGFDIAPGMVEAATARCRGLDGVRFFVGDGLGVPDAARDRSYGLVLTVAVFIHCPKPVVGANVESAWPLVAPGGQLRFQVLADPADPTGLEVAHSTDELRAEVAQVVDQTTDDERRMAAEAHYMGHRFRYDEVRELMERRARGGRVALYRGDLGAIYGLVEKSEA